MLWILVGLCFLVQQNTIYCEHAGNGSQPTVELSTGDILEGGLVSVPSGARANIFLGVPYAQPPIGKLRFSKPVDLVPEAKPKEKRRLSCVKYQKSCLQNHTRVSNPITDIDEDCLYLNVFAGLQCNSDNLCPVLYYIHGGAFEFDSPSMFPVDLLVENFATHGLVFITVNYRLGVMGFFATGGQAALGNYGMHDTISGLRFVQREIRSFGGDPNKVTIMGHSSGAFMVVLLSLAPAARGLFDSMVVMSTPKVMLGKDVTYYRRLAEDLGCARKTDWLLDHANDERILECMRRMPADVLVNKFRFYEEQLDEWAILSSPIFDEDLFPRQVDELRRNRRTVHTMIGTVENEAGDTKLYDPVNATAETVAMKCKMYIGTSEITKNEQLLNELCKRRYGLRTEEDGDDVEKKKRKNSTYGFWTDQAENLENDARYFAPTFLEAASLAEKGSRVFLYNFEYVKRGLEDITPYHAFDLTYVMGIHPFQFDERDRAIKAVYVPLFVNFAKYGQPTPNMTQNDTHFWTELKYPPTQMNYMSVDLPRAVLKQPYHYDGVLFWDYVVPTLGGRNYNKKLVRKLDDSGEDIGVKSRENYTVPMGNSVTIEGQSSVDYKTAFWITLAVALLLMVLLLAVSCRRWKKRRAYAMEERALLGGMMKNADSYSTFY